MSVCFFECIIIFILQIQNACQMHFIRVCIISCSRSIKLEYLELQQKLLISWINARSCTCESRHLIKIRIRIYSIVIFPTISNHYQYSNYFSNLFNQFWTLGMGFNWLSLNQYCNISPALHSFFHRKLDNIRKLIEKILYIKAPSTHWVNAPDRT